MVLTFSDINTFRVDKMPYRDSPHHETELLKNFNYLNLFRPNQHTEDYYHGGPNGKIFLLEIEDKKYVYLGKS